VAKLKLGALIDDKPVKVTVELPAYAYAENRGIDARARAMPGL